MKIKIELNQKSINNALKILEKIKKQLKGEMINEFLVECCKAIISLASQRLEFVDIGESVKNEILLSWDYTVLGNKATIKNTAEKAVYVEFGVGIVGSQNPHDNAAMTGYAYNMPSIYKFDDGTWLFETTLEDLDLPKKDIIEHNSLNSGSLVVETKGTPATMFVYHSIIDFKDRQIAKNIWEDIKKKYWG